MGRKNESKEIDGHVYEVTQLGAIEGRKVFSRYAAIMTKLDPRLPEAKLQQAAQLALMADSEALEFFGDVFAKHTLVRGEGVLSRNFNEHFAGRMLAMIQWIGFCFEVNFADFFAASQAKAAETTGNESSSPNTLTSQSGESS